MLFSEQYGEIKMQTLDTILRGIILIELFLGLGVWVYWACRHKEKYKYSIAPILYILHALTFLMFTLLNCLSRDVYIVWRDLLFVHGLLILNLVGILLIQLRRDEVE